MFEIILAMGVAAIGIFFLVTAFSKTSTGTTSAATSRKPQGQTAAKAAPAQEGKKKKKHQKSKKEIAAEKREEAEIERLIAAQGASVSGMPTDKAKVVSLDDAKPKKEVAKKNSGNRAAPITTKQRIIDQEAGFSYVEKKTKTASPVAKDNGDGRDMDRELTRFFKQADKRGKDKEKAYGSKKDDDNSKSTGKVSMKKKFTSDPTDLWAQGRTWE